MLPRNSGSRSPSPWEAAAAWGVADVFSTASGVAPVSVLQTHVPRAQPFGATQNDISFGQARNSAPRPTSAGLNGLPPRPP